MIQVNLIPLLYSIANHQVVVMLYQYFIISEIRFRLL